MNENNLQKEAAKRGFSGLTSWIKTHKKIVLSVVAVILVCVLTIGVITIIHAQQARQIEQAQIGKCYALNYTIGNSYYTEVYRFMEEGCAELHLSFEDEERQKLEFSFGSLDEVRHYSFIHISLLGKMTFNGNQIEVDEQNQITTIINPYHTSISWEEISLDEARALEKKMQICNILNGPCRNSAVGTEGFKQTIAKAMPTASNLPAATASDEEYISAAKSLISEYLKNPSSAVYNSESVVETDDYGRGIVHLDISAQNSFGGYVRTDYFVCIQEIRGNHYTYHSASCYVESRSMLDYLKMANDWGEDPTVRYDTKKFSPGEPTLEASVEVSDFTLDRYVFPGKNVTYVAYIEPISQYVVAAELIVSKDVVHEMDKKDQTILAGAIKGTMQATNTYGGSQYTKVFTPEDGVVSRTPFFDDYGCMYHATEKNGNYHISVTNAQVFGFDSSNYWSPVK